MVVAVYVAKRYADGKLVGLYGVVNFAIFRYTKVFPVYVGV